MKHMLIGQFCDTFFPVIDGVTMVTHHYAAGLNRRLGTTGGCTVITAGVPGYQEQSAEYQIIRYASMPLAVRPPYRFAMPQLDPWLIRRIQSIPFSLLHAHSPFGCGRLALAIARRRRIPLVASFHSKYYEDFLSALNNEAIARLALKNIMHFYAQADAVWTVNQATEKTLRTYGYAGPIQIVPNGVDFSSNDLVKERKRSNLKWTGVQVKPHQPIFLYVGQLIWQKNLRLICDALQCLKNSWSAPADSVPFRMFFVGSGADEQAVRQYVNTSGLNSTVTFLGLIRDRSCLQQLYHSADLLLFPSQYDTFSLVLREAAAMACPAVLSRTATIAGDVTDRVNAYLSDDDAGSFSDTIKDALMHPDHRQMVAANARETLCHTWDQVIELVYARYAEILISENQLNRSSALKTAASG
jgi:glycosyltransferase involved in cell wall biosynthesis